MTGPHGAMKLGRCKFISRSGTTVRKLFPPKMAEKYPEAKRIHRFREIRRFDTARNKNDFSVDLASFAPVRYYSTANRSTSHVLRDTSASEGPPAGPEKCSYTLRFDQCNQNFEILNFTKTWDFSAKISRFRGHDPTLCSIDAPPL